MFRKIHTFGQQWLNLKAASVALVGCAALMSTSAFAQVPKPAGCPSDIADYPGNRALNQNGGQHIEQSDLIAGKFDFRTLFNIGGALAESRFNECDGEGRPATTGAGDKRAPGQPQQNRVSGPEATSCVGCHAQPRSGGSGDFVANTFNGAEADDPISYTVDPSLSNERNTTGMFGAGLIELMALEMTGDLRSQAAKWNASKYYVDGWKTFVTKGVSFDAFFTNHQITDSRGVNTDLIVRPFGAGGTKVSLREFNVGAANRHHGMQAEEAYDIYKGDPDYDQDGVKRELTIGDITALDMWSAGLDMPNRRMPPDVQGNQEEMKASVQGEKLFGQIGCGGCHTPRMMLNSHRYCDPNPYNPPGIFNDTTQSYCVTLDISPNNPQKNEKNNNGDFGVILETYTDLKRHHMCDDPSQAGAIRSLCNEQLPEGRPSQDGYPGQEFFLTADLWQVAESAPWGHDGRYNSMVSIILAHAGEARMSRDSFAALSQYDQLLVIRFLRTLRIRDQKIRVQNG